MADEPAGSSGQDDNPDVHHAPTQAWQGPGTPPPPPGAPQGGGGQQPPSADPHYAPTQAWQGPGSPPPPPPGQPQGGQQPPAAPSSPSVDPHYAPTQAWQGPGTPPPPPGQSPPPPPPPQPRGDYGYPQQPQPQPPAYGQQPGSPYGQPQPQPQPQGNYGYPQQSGYPQPGGYPPQGGYPQQPGYPMPPGPGRSGGNKNGLIAGIIGGVVAIAVIAGVVFAVSGDDDDGPGGDTKRQSADPIQLASGKFQFEPERSELWKVSSGDSSPADRTTLIGQWVGDKSIVVGDQSTMTAYDIKTGKELWKSPGPESGSAPCAMSSGLTADGLGAVLYRKSGSRTSGPCTLLTVIDTATGNVKWHEDVRSDAEDGRDNSVAIDEKNERVYAITANMAFSYALDTGKKDWDAGGAKYCNLSGETAATAVVVEQTCFDTNKTIIASLDLGNGHDKSRWKYTVPGDSSSKAKILSADPAVAGINPGSASARGNVVMFDASGKPGPEIAMSQPFGKLPEDTIFDSFSRYRFQGTTMIATIGKGAAARPTTVAAFDMTTGKEKWHQEVGSTQKAVQVIGFEGDSVLAAVSGDYSDQGQLVQMPMATGVPAMGGKFPENSLRSLDRNPIVVRGDLVFALSSYASQYSPRVTAFGPKG